MPCGNLYCANCPLTSYTQVPSASLHYQYMHLLLVIIYACSKIVRLVVFERATLAFVKRLGAHCDVPEQKINFNAREQS